MIVRLMTRGFFAGQFIATTDDRTFSLGDYLEVTHIAPAYVADHLDIGAVVAFPVQIDFSAVEQTFKTEIHILMGRMARHYMECLKVGHAHTIVACQFKYRKYTCWMPKIDGQVPGLHGPTKISS